MSTIDDPKVEINVVDTSEEEAKKNGNKKPTKTIHVDWEAEEFKPFGHIMRVNSIDLARSISRRYAKVFHDYKGCNIICGAPNQFFVQMVFEYNPAPVPEGKYRALVNVLDRSDIKTSNSFIRMQALQPAAIQQNQKTPDVFQLTEEAKQILSDCTYPHKNGDRFWKDTTSCIHSQAAPVSYGYGAPMMPGADKITVVFTGLSLRSVLKKLFKNSMIKGLERDKNGENVVRISGDTLYEARFIKVKPSDGSFYMNIEQFDRQTTEELIAEEYPNYNINFSNIVYY